MTDQLFLLIPAGVETEYESKTARHWKAPTDFKNIDFLLPYVRQNAFSQFGF